MESLEVQKARGSEVVYILWGSLSNELKVKGWAEEPGDKNELIARAGREAAFQMTGKFINDMQNQPIAT